MQDFRAYNLLRKGSGSVGKSGPPDRISLITDLAMVSSAAGSRFIKQGTKLDQIGLYLLIELFSYFRSEEIDLGHNNRMPVEGQMASSGELLYKRSAEVPMKALDQSPFSSV
jgi:hypothetical protein